MVVGAAVEVVVLAGAVVATVVGAADVDDDDVGGSIDTAVRSVVSGLDEHALTSNTKPAHTPAAEILTLLKFMPHGNTVVWPGSFTPEIGFGGSPMIVRGCMQPWK